MSSLKYMTLREEVLNAIRGKILKQELKPGMRIIEQNLSDEYGISRGPIREALRQLEQEGLIEYTRNAGCTVRQTSIEDVYELYLLRCHYEMMAVKSALALEDADFARMEDLLKQMKRLTQVDLMEFARLDNEFHAILVENCGLKMLFKVWTDLKYSSILAGMHAGSYADNMASRMYEIHMELYQAAKNGDVEKLCYAIYRHYMYPMKRLMEENGVADKTIYRFEEAFVRPAAE